MTETRERMVISIDFDGVLHSYTSGWQGADVIGDPPVAGAIAWLRALLADGRFAVCIYSSRNHQGGILAMREWLERHGLPFQEQWQGDLYFPEFKPPAHLVVDDRAWCFTGDFPDPDTIAAFKPWWKR